VVVDVSLTQVLRVGILVRIMVVVHGRVVMFVVVSVGHVFPARSVPLVVDHVSVLVCVHQRIVVMERQYPHLLESWVLASQMQRCGPVAVARVDQLVDSIERGSRREHLSNNAESRQLFFEPRSGPHATRRAGTDDEPLGMVSQHGPQVLDLKEVALPPPPMLLDARRGDQHVAVDLTSIDHEPPELVTIQVHDRHDRASFDHGPGPNIPTWAESGHAPELTDVAGAEESSRCSLAPVPDAAG